MELGTNAPPKEVSRLFVEVIEYSDGITYLRSPVCKEVGIQDVDLFPFVCPLAQAMPESNPTEFIAQIEYCCMCGLNNMTGHSGRRQLRRDIGLQEISPSHIAGVQRGSLYDVAIAKAYPGEEGGFVGSLKATNWAFESLLERFPPLICCCRERKELSRKDKVPPFVCSQEMVHRRLPRPQPQKLGEFLWNDHRGRRANRFLSVEGVCGTDRLLKVRRYARIDLQDRRKAQLTDDIL